MQFETNKSNLNVKRKIIPTIHVISTFTTAPKASGVMVCLRKKKGKIKMQSKYYMFQSFVDVN